MKKIFTFVLAMMLVFATCTLAFAAENVDTEIDVTESVYAPESTNATVSINGVMTGSTPVYSVPLSNVGANPTFSFSISGNPDLYVDVTAVSPIGGEFTVFSNIRCDGTTHSAYHFSLVSGTYYFTIRVNHGSSSGQRKDYTISAEW